MRFNSGFKGLMSELFNDVSTVQFTVFSITFVPATIQIDFHSEQFHKLECVQKMFIPPSILKKPLDTLVEWPKTEIWGWAIGLLCCLVILFIYVSHLNFQKNTVSNYQTIERLTSSCQRPCNSQIIKGTLKHRNFITSTKFISRSDIMSL